MKRLFFGFVFAAAALTVTLPASTSADIGLTTATPVVLSCSDGHSVALAADPATLSSLTADVQAINASATGTSCALDTSAAAPIADADWTVYDYNASGQEIAPRNSPNSDPATTTGGTTSFNFLPGHYTALLTTNDKALTGDLTGATLTDHIDLSGSATTFETQHNGGSCTTNFPAAVRFFFVAPAASGKTGDPGFYTQFWWSNPMHLDLLQGDQSGDITVQMNPAEWSDWNGQSGLVHPENFAIAASKAQEIGLSFGGDCIRTRDARALGRSRGLRHSPSGPTRSAAGGNGPARAARLPRRRAELEPLGICTFTGSSRSARGTRLPWPALPGVSGLTLLSDAPSHPLCR